MNYKIQHYVFNTYKNNSVLTDPVVIGFLYNCFKEISKIKGFDLVACKILEDHVHCLVKFPASHRIEYPIKMIKGISSRSFFKAYKTNRLVFRKLWARSYFAREIIGSEETNKVVEYINNQIDPSGYDKRYNK